MSAPVGSVSRSSSARSRRPRRAIAHRPALSVAFRAGDPAREAPGASGPRSRTQHAGGRREDRRRARGADGQAADAASRSGHPGRRPRARRGRRRGTPASPPQRETAPRAEPERRIRPRHLRGARAGAGRGARRQPDGRRRLQPRQRARRPRPPASRIRARTRPALAEALELYARESLVGFSLPKAERALLDKWRPWLESRTGQDWQGLRRQLGAQEEFGIHVREMLAHLGLAEDLGEQPEDEDDSEDEGRGAGRGVGRCHRRGRRRRHRSGAERCRGQRQPGRARRGRRQRRPPGRDHRPWCDRRGRGPRGAVRDAAVHSARRRGAGLPGLHHPLRRGHRGERALQPARARPSAQPARSSARPPAGHDRPHGQPPAAAPARPADPLLGLRSRRGAAGYRAPDPRRGQSRASAVVQAREGHRVPRHRGLAADRQLRLDARPADRGRGDVRRHPRAHPGALRRQGRDPGLHDAQLEGRPGPRAVAARGQAAQSRPPQRPAPHRLQAGRQPLAPRAAQSRPDAARRAAQGEHRRRGDPVGAPAPARRGRSSARS